MKIQGLKIENMYHKKILLYQDLLDVLNQERQSIKEIDVDMLWKVSDKKQEITNKIGDLRQTILDEITGFSTSHGMDISTFKTAEILSLLPNDLADRLRKAHLTLVSLKAEVKMRLDENKKSVGEYLEVLDELIGIITDAGEPKPLYGKTRCPEKMTTHLFLHREV